MAGFLLKRLIHWSPHAQVIVLVIGVLSSFSVAYSKGDVSLYLPFISETGAFVPAQCIFSMALIFGSFIGILISFSRFIILYENRLNEEKYYFWLNTSSCIFGVTSMFGMAGVAAFPMTTVFWAHILSAAIYFICSWLYFSCVTLTTFKIEGKSLLFYFRLVLTIIILILMMILVICFPISLMQWHKYNTIIPARKTPDNEGFTLILVSSILEWIVVGTIIMYTLSLSSELGNHNILISTVKEERNRDPIVEGIVASVPERSIAT